jgi:hemerythrin-like domain-containing protein
MMTSTETEALKAILTHHRLLEDDVNARVAALQRVVDTGGPHEPAVAELVAYLGGEVLPHALAEEHSIYRVALARAELGGTVTEMITEHRSLALATERLAEAPNGDAAAAQAQEIATLFSVHVAKENDVLLPPLVADNEVDLAQLLLQMHRLTEAAQQESPLGEDASALDPDAVMLSLLLEAATDLAHAGYGDRACRHTASAWAALRVPRPELAVRVTAALHRLVRLATAEPVVFRPPSDGQHPLGDPALDVRQLAPAQRHESIFETYQALASGAGFVLVNDHDPKPLRYRCQRPPGAQPTDRRAVDGPPPTAMIQLADTTRARKGASL